MSERKMIYLCLAHMSEDGIEQKYVKEAFDTNWVVPMGPNVNAFEAELAAMANSVKDTRSESGMTEVACALNIPAGQWHTLRALESGTVIMEMKDGPYEPIRAGDVMER